MKRIIFLLLITSLSGLLACDDFLNIKPKGYTIPEFFDDYRKLMNDAQVMGKAMDDYPCNITDNALYAEPDIPYYNLDEAYYNSYRYLYTFKSGAIFNEGESDNFWEAAYNRLYYCNTVIYNIMDVTDASENAKLNLKAEALVARAFEYLSLIGVYAPAYDAATAATDYGVPIIAALDVTTINYTRNTVAEVYKAIEDDLDEALPDLSETVANSFRPAKTVGYGFKARMYLMMQDYDMALENALAALATNDELTDMKLYTLDEDANIVLESDMLTPYPSGDDNPENIYTRFAPYVYGINGSIFASEDLKDTYARDLPVGAEDMRRTLWFQDDENSRGDQFPGYSLYSSGIRSNVGLNTVEVLLTAAEGYARKGDATSLEKASDLYNQLRDNRIKGNIHVSFATRSEALNKVLDERRREFPFVGTYRLIDLKRLNKEPEFQKTITHTYKGQTYTLPPNDNRYIFPVPPKVKAFRPDLPDYDR